MFLSLLVVVVLGSLTCSLCMLGAVYLCGFIERSNRFALLNLPRRGQQGGLERPAREPVLVRHQYGYRETIQRPRRRDNG